VISECIITNYQKGLDKIYEIVKVKCRIKRIELKSWEDNAMHWINDIILDYQKGRFR